MPTPAAGGFHEPYTFAMIARTTPATLRIAMLAMLASAVALLAPGCATTPEAASLARKERLETPAITHVVLVQLKDPSRTAELVADCDRALPGIESVRGYACGVPMETGRSNVIGDYDVGIYVGFVDATGYRAYLDDPRHLDLVERWREGWKAVRIFDVISPGAPEARTPPAAEPAPASQGSGPSAPAPSGATPEPDARSTAPANADPATPQAAPNGARATAVPGATRNPPAPAQAPAPAPR